MSTYQYCLCGTSFCNYTVVANVFSFIQHQISDPNTFDLDHLI